jgi:hypothetical protein
VTLVVGYSASRVFFALLRTSWRLWIRTRCSTPALAKDSAMEKPMPLAKQKSVAAQSYGRANYEPPPVIKTVLFFPSKVVEGEMRS